MDEIKLNLIKSNRWYDPLINSTSKASSKKDNALLISIITVSVGILILGIIVSIVLIKKSKRNVLSLNKMELEEELIYT